MSDMLNKLNMLVGKEITLNIINYVSKENTNEKGVLIKHPASDDFILCGENLSADIDDILCCKVFYSELKEDNSPVIEVNIFDDN